MPLVAFVVNRLSTDRNRTLGLDREDAMGYGIEGLIHVSEMSWTERVKHPSKLINVGDEVECKVLEVDSKNKRISLGLKQLQENPWDALEIKFPVGTIVEGEVKSVTDFGVFIDIGMGIDGLVHISELANFRVKKTEDIVKMGDEIWVKCLGVDEKGRVRLSRKAAMEDRDKEMAAPADAPAANS